MKKKFTLSWLFLFVLLSYTVGQEQKIDLEKIFWKKKRDLLKEKEYEAVLAVNIPATNAEQHFIYAVAYLHSVQVAAIKSVNQEQKFTKHISSYLHKAQQHFEQAKQNQNLQATSSSYLYIITILQSENSSLHTSRFDKKEIAKIVDKQLFNDGVLHGSLQKYIEEVNDKSKQLGSGLVKELEGHQKQIAKVTSFIYTLKQTIKAANETIHKYTQIEEGQHYYPQKQNLDRQLNKLLHNINTFNNSLEKPLPQKNVVVGENKLLERRNVLKAFRYLHGLSTKHEYTQKSVLHMVNSWKNFDSSEFKRSLNVVIKLLFSIYGDIGKHADLLYKIMEDNKILKY